MPRGRIQVVSGVPAVGRKTRSPKHTFQLRNRPFAIQPFCIAPVLPGETLKSWTMQARAVTDPIDNPIVGWTKEYFLFYVKLTDLYDRETIISMLVDPTASLAALDHATNVPYYHTNGTMSPGVNWTLLCTQRVVDEYFRYEGEAYGDFTISNPAGGSLYAAPINRNLFIDSLINDDAITEASSIDQNLVSAVAGQGDATTNVWASEIERVLREYNLARLHGVTELTYEEWLRQHGVNIPGGGELHKPELLRVVREWQYPSNTIDPTNGTPRSAVSWAIADRGEKSFLFKEPGFLLGLTVTRPKVYFENLTSSAAMCLNSVKDWSINLSAADPWSSMKKMSTAGDPPVDANTDAYWFDMKDYFLYGDQFINFLLNDGVANIVALPLATGVHRYLTTDAELDGLFVAASPANQIREDGVIQFHILSAMRETTPNVFGSNDL